MKTDSFTTQPVKKLFFHYLLCLLQGCVLSVLFVYILPIFFGIVGIWASVPLAEFITLGVAIFFLNKTTRRECI